ncbi:MAG: hypothetical protein ABW164_07330 [Sphingobium sp.]
MLALCAGLWAVRHHRPAVADGLAVLLCTLSTVSLAGAMVVIFETGREASRLMALAALLLGAVAMAACLTATLRIVADPRQEP